MKNGAEKGPLIASEFLEKCGRGERKKKKNNITDVLSCWPTLFWNYNVSTWWIITVIKLELNRGPAVLPQCRINGSFFSLSHFRKYTQRSLGLQWKMPHLFVWKACPHLHNAEHNMAKWSKLEPPASAEPYYWWPYITLYRSQVKHICFHLTKFPCKHLNRDSSPISVIPPCLFKPACVSYIKPLPFFSPCLFHAMRRISERIWLQNTVSRERAMML